LQFYSGAVRLSLRSALVPSPRAHRRRYFGVLAPTAASGKFPQRPRTAGCGRTKTLPTHENRSGERGRRSWSGTGNRGSDPRGRGRPRTRPRLAATPTRATRGECCGR